MRTARPREREEIDGGRCRRVRFGCDDRAGFELVVLQAGDGDFHVSILPRRADFAEGCIPHDDPAEMENYGALYSASVRIRMPVSGGGSHERLWHALAGLFKP